MTLILKQFRKKHRLSREQLSVLLGVSLYTVARWERREDAEQEIPARYKLALNALEKQMSHRQDLRTDLTADRQQR